MNCAEHKSQQLIRTFNCRQLFDSKALHEDSGVVFSVNQILEVQTWVNTKRDSGLVRFIECHNIGNIPWSTGLVWVSLAQVTNMKPPRRPPYSYRQHPSFSVTSASWMVLIPVVSKLRTPFPLRFDDCVTSSSGCDTEDTKFSFLDTAWSTRGQRRLDRFIHMCELVASLP